MFQSTLKLIYNLTECHIETEEGWEEHITLSSATNVGLGKGLYNTPNRNKFWVNIANKIYSKDDFKFNGLCGVKWNNTFKLFELFFNPKRILEFYLEHEEQIDLTKVSEEMTDNDLFADIDNEKFSENGWRDWCDYIAKNETFQKFLVNVFQHEFLHIIWGHVLEYRTKDNHRLYNIATDWAINQTLNFTDEIAPHLITEKNHEFYGEYLKSLVKWLALDPKTEREILKICKVDNLTDEAITQNFNLIYHNFLVEIDPELGRYGRAQTKFQNESAEFYYSVLKDSGFDSSKISIAFEHDDAPPEEGSGGGDEDDDPTEDEPEEIDGSGDGDKEDETDTPSDKNRSNEGEVKHSGFDTSNAEMSKAIKKIVEESIEKAGYDTENPEDVERSLREIKELQQIEVKIKEWFNVKKVSWRKHLNKVVLSHINPINHEPTMRRAHRALPGVYPGKHRAMTLDVIIGVDTSGSIDEMDWKTFIGQMEKIAKDCQIDRVRMLQCHTRVCFDEMVSLKKAKKIRVVETGGTIMRPLFNQLEKEKNHKMVILFTDGDFYDIQENIYSYDIILFITNKRNKERLENCGFKVIVQAEE